MNKPGGEHSKASSSADGTIQRDEELWNEFKSKLGSSGIANAENITTHALLREFLLRKKSAEMEEGESSSGDVKNNDTDKTDAVAAGVGENEKCKSQQEAGFRGLLSRRFSGSKLQTASNLLSELDNEEKGSNPSADAGLRSMLTRTLSGGKLQAAGIISELENEVVDAQDQVIEKCSDRDKSDRRRCQSVSSVQEAYASSSSNNLYNSTIGNAYNSRRESVPSAKDLLGRAQSIVNIGETVRDQVQRTASESGKRRSSMSALFNLSGELSLDDDSDHD